MSSQLVTYEWATIIGRLLRSAPLALYIEFQNNGGVAVTPPTPTRSGGRSYYDGLAASLTEDYLRVPVALAYLDSSDETEFPDGNRLKVTAETSGTAGVNGKPFNSSVQSRIYGGAVVYAPVWNDPTQDLVLCRFYYDTADQSIKPSVAQLLVSQVITFN